MADEVVVRETLSVTHVNVSDADLVLAAKFNEVGYRALQQADRYLAFGPHDARLAVTRAFIPAMSKLASLSGRDEMRASRETLLAELDRMTAGFVEDGYRAVAVLEAAAEAVDDKDNGARLPKPRS